MTLTLALGRKLCTVMHPCTYVISDLARSITIEYSIQICVPLSVCVCMLTGTEGTRVRVYTVRTHSFEHPAPLLAPQSM